jgi:RNA polymerase sigma-70 factor (ECF subfamily)
MTSTRTRDGWNDEDLLEGVAGGDGAALAVLFRRHKSTVFRFALHMSDPGVADDVTQEVFLAVIRDAARFERGRSSVAAWLCGIARNHVRRRLERDRRLMPFDDAAEPAGEIEATGPAVWEDLERADRIDAVRRAVQALPLGYREAVVLCDLQEMTYADAAAALECPIGTVRSRVHRGRALLAAALRAEASAPPAPGVARPVRGCA